MTSKSIASASSFIVTPARVAGLVACALAALPSAARAEPRVAVLAFEGEAGDTFRDEVVALLDSDYKILSAAKYEKAADKLGADTMTAADVRKVAKKIKAQAVVVGEVEENDGRYRVIVRVRSGSTGNYVGKPASASVADEELTSKAKKSIDRTLRAAIEEAGRAAGAAVDDGELGGGGGDEPAEEREPEPEPEPKKKKRKKVVAAAAEEEDEPPPDEEPPPEEEAEEEEAAAIEEDSDGAARKVDPLSPAARVSLGGGAGARRLKFRANGTILPEDYKTGVVPAVVLSGEVYPLAFDRENRAITRDIGLSLVFARVLKIESDVPGMDITLPTEQQRFGIGLVFRKTFASGLTLVPSIRYNKAKFEIDRTEAEAAAVDIGVPNVDYSFFDPGLGVRYPVGRKLLLSGEGRFLLVTKAGEIQQTDQYGSAKITGFDADAHGDYWITPRLFATLGGQLTGYAFDFNPGEVLAARIDLDDDGAQDVGGALDLWFGGYLAAGYVF